MLGPGGKCYGCGELTTDIHSGVHECPKCWCWRKLDAPAAHHWYAASEEFLSSVDMHDVMNFFPKRIGWTQDELLAVIEMVTELRDKTETMIKDHGEVPRKLQ